jgi:PEGA domain
MESPLDDFPSEPIPNSSGSTLDVSQDQFAPIVDPISPTRHSKTRKRHHIAASMVSLEPIRAASVRAFHKCVAVTTQVGPSLQRLPAALDRSWRTTAAWVESRRLRPRTSTSLADEITHIAHDAGLTQDVVVASLQRAVAECVEREASRRTTHDQVGTPPRVLALVVATALIVGVAYGIMWHGPWIVAPTAALRSSGVAAAAPSLRQVVPVANAEPASVPVGKRPETTSSSVVPAAPVTIARPGQLRIVTEPPGARVTVNGVGRGMTPLTIRHLPPGAKRVRVTKDGYSGAERMISLAEGDPGRTVRIPLERMQ